MTHERGLYRRTVLRTGGVLGAVGAGALPASAAAADGAPEGLALVNGKIHTMDPANPVVSAVLIDGDRFAALGNGARVDGPGVRVVNLHGRTVVPGIIEGHVHIVSLANRPGYHVILENATSIAEIQSALAARRPDVPDGEFVTAMGGWHPNFFAQRRLPTRAELDDAVPDRPVLLFQSFTGPSVTNSLGKAFFESASIPVVVADDGAIAAGLPSTTALYHLRVRQTFADKVRSTHDAMR